MITFFSELGRRMARLESVAARNLASDMLAPAVLCEWLAHYPVKAPKAKNVLVVTAGNIPFVGLHDVLCTLASGHRAIVRPSSRDFDNMSWVVDNLLDIAPSLPVSLDDGNRAIDAVIAMGGNTAIDAIGLGFSDLPKLLRGNRSSLAHLSGRETAEDLTALANDILMHGGRGCRNVSLVFVPRHYDFAPLQNALARWVGDIEPRYVNSLRQARALAQMQDVAYIDCGTVLLIENRDFPARIGVVDYAFYDSADNVTDWLSAHNDEIQCVVSATPFYPRTVGFGRTQHPGPGDYPNGVDTMKFLLAL